MAKHMIMANGIDHMGHNPQDTKKLEGTPLLCYEVWYEDDAGNRQMVGAYWDVIVAWRVMEAINKSVYGNLGVAEVAVVSGWEQSVGTLVRQPRTDVLNEQGMRSNPNG